MSDDSWFDDFDLEKLIKERFGLTIEVGKVIGRRLPAGQSVTATVFLTSKKQLFCYIDGYNRLTLGDIKKLAARIGLKPDEFFPPKGRPQYFDEIGREKFSQVFPGRHDVSPEDIQFYRTLAPYMPALISVREVRDGTIYCADSDARGGWRPAVKFAYRRIQTS